VRISAKVIGPAGGKLFDAQAIERAIEQELDHQADLVRQEFEKTTATWSHKPAFMVQRSPWQRDIGTDDQQYFWINAGTSVRYAHMTRNFSPKTAPGIIGSMGGSGGLAFISKKHPRPGIKAREFDKAIAKTWEPILARALQDAINRTVK
jgi:hypothetical protein